MAVITKGATGLALTTGANWVGSVAPGAADVARWASTSGPATGNLTGSLTILGLQIDGALGNPTHTSGTLTLTQTDAFVNGTGDNVAWIASGGVIALGSGNRNFKMWRAGSVAILLNAAGSLTGTGVLTLINNGGTSSFSNASLGSSGAHAGFTNAIVLADYTAIKVTAAVSSFTACNFTIDGVGCGLVPTVAGATLGGSGKTLTVNQDVLLGASGLLFTVAPNVVLAGTGTRTLTVDGETNLTGAVSSSTGIIVAGASKYVRLNLSGSSSLAGMSGPLTVLSGGFVEYVAQAWTPTTLDVATDGRVRLTIGSTNYTFIRTPTGAGWIDVRGTAATGLTFPAAPAEGNIADFAGSVRAQAVAGESSRIVISDLPGGLGFVASANAASPAILTQITYNGAGQTKATSVTVDSENNTSTANLTSGTYALLSSGSGPLVLTGAVERTNSTAGVTPTASARMSLTLGGTNTGNNTLSGDISEVGTNSAILGITKVDAGRWVLSGANSSHTGIHTISAGTLSAQSAKALGSATSAGGVTISGTGVLELAGGITLNKSATAFTIHQTSPITSVGDNTVQTAGITLGGTTTFEVTTGNRLAIANSGAITDGASTFGVTKTGDGELALAAFANTYDGAVTVTAGTLAVGSLGALGTGVATVQLTGNLKYTGTGETLSRATLLNGSAPSFEASGSGALTVSNLSTSVSTKTLTLKGSNTGANTITSSLTDNSGVLSLAKEDAGTWVVTIRTYSGTTAVNAGTLRCESTNSATTSGAVTIGASGTVELVTNTLASSGAGNGEVLGTGHVTCNGGTIKTRGGTTQKGQVRYGGNLTFGAGSSLYIGAAA